MVKTCTDIKHSCNVRTRIIWVYHTIDPVTMATGVLSDGSKTRHSLVFRAGSKSFRYRVSKSRRSLQLKRTAAVITIVAP